MTTEKLEVSVRSLIDLGFNGVNVTIPHKTNVLFADSITDRAALIGAANTLYFSKMERSMQITLMGMDLFKK